jgi:two-component system, chemotaxis family, chemotaxis protein CheY
MQNPTINLNDLVILVADPNPYVRRLISGMLRGFGANKLLEVDQASGLMQALIGQKIDILLCDARLPPHDGLALTQNIRRDIHNENRTMPILIMSGDGSEATIKRARDAGANMVIAKPISAKTLYDRLTWIAFRPRKFVDTATYFGPDRRFKIEGYPNGIGRRQGDNILEVAEEVGPALAQDDIDNLFSATRTGQS